MDNYYKQIIDQSPMGIACHKIICDGAGKPCDYDFLEVNKAFETLTGLKASKIVGRRVTEVMPDIIEDPFDWIGFYGEIALNGGEKEIEQYSKELNKWYKVFAFSPERFYFEVIISEITEQMLQLSAYQNLAKLSEEFLQMSDDELDYQKITDDFLKLTGAKYAVFNLFDENGEGFTTKALSGNKGVIKKATNALGFKIADKKWEPDPVRAAKIKDSMITRFPSMQGISDGVIPKTIIALLEKTFKVGQVVLVKITKNNVMLGDFTLVMAKGELFDRDTIAELYTRQLGLVIERKRAETEIVETKKYFEQVFNASPDASVITRADDGRIENLNEGFVTLSGYAREEALGKSTLDLNLYRYPEERQKLVDELKAHGRFRSDATIFRQKDGSLFTGLFSSKIFLHKGAAYVSSNIRDISNRKQMEDALKESEEKYRHLIDNSHDIIYTLTTEGLVSFVSPAGSAQIGYSGPQVIGQPIINLVHPDDKTDVMKSIIAVIDDGKNQEGIEYRIKHLDGSWRWFSSSATPQKNKSGKIIGLEGIARDITERKNSEIQIQASEEKYRLLTENVSDVIWIFNVAEEKFTYVSPSVFSLRGFTPEEALQETFSDSLTPESYTSFTQAMSGYAEKMFDDLQADISFSVEVRQPCKNGSLIWVEISAKFRYGLEHDLEIIGASRNIESRKKAEEEVLYLSHHDQLTGLYNRRHFDNEMHRLNDEKYLPLILIMADVNGLKLTNDVFGHKVGDLLLEKVARIIKKECRTEDIVARIGGDEFVILLPESDAKNADIIISRINKAIEKESIEDAVFSLSMGYAIKRNVSDDMDEIIKKAEDEMYKKKLSESAELKNKTIDLIMQTLYKKNNKEMAHSKNVSDISAAIAYKIDGMSEENVRKIRTAALLHDIGKIGIKEEILKKSVNLTIAERLEMQRHTEIGYRILSSVNELSEIADCVLEHHERWDGKGYPRGLKGNEISIQARIISVADAYDNMTIDIHYKENISEEEAIKELRRLAGTQFDSEVARIFVEDVLGKQWE